MSIRHPARGLTLIEVLIVIVIVTLLLGLTAVAVQQARSTAARTACGHNLRQLGQALHQYHAVRGVLPPGVSHPALRPGIPRLFGPDSDPYPLLNWQARLLPYIEQEALWRITHEAYAKDRHMIKNPPHAAMTIHIPILLCPVESPRGQTGLSPELAPAVTWYVGIAGSTHQRANGVLFLDSRVRLRAISDGTSNTLMAGERPPSLDLAFGRWYGGWGHWSAYNAFLGVRENGLEDHAYHCLDGPYEFRAGGLSDPCSALHFWSLHSGGANFLAADGSVRFLTYSAAPLLPALATRAGREPSVWPD